MKKNYIKISTKTRIILIILGIILYLIIKYSKIIV